MLVDDPAATWWPEGLPLPMSSRKELGLTVVAISATLLFTGRIRPISGVAAVVLRSAMESLRKELGDTYCFAASAMTAGSSLWENVLPADRTLVADEASVRLSVPEASLLPADESLAGGPLSLASWEFWEFLPSFSPVLRLSRLSGNLDVLFPLPGGTAISGLLSASLPPRVGVWSRAVAEKYDSTMCPLLLPAVRRMGLILDSVGDRNPLFRLSRAFWSGRSSLLQMAVDSSGGGVMGTTSSSSAGCRFS